VAEALPGAINVAVTLHTLHSPGTGLPATGMSTLDLGEQWDLGVWKLKDNGEQISKRQGKGMLTSPGGNEFFSALLKVI